MTKVMLKVGQTIFFQVFEVNDARGIGRIVGRLGGLGRNAGRSIGSKGLSRVKDLGKRVFRRTGRRGGTSRTGGGFRARVSRTKGAGKKILGRSGNTGGSSRSGLRGGLKDFGKKIFGRSGTPGGSSSSGGLRGGLSKIKDFGKRIFGSRKGASSADGVSGAGKGSTLKRVATGQVGSWNPWHCWGRNYLSDQRGTLRLR